jgi:hypothetical protein
MASIELNTPGQISASAGTAELSHTVTWFLVWAAIFPFTILLATVLACFMLPRSAFLALRSLV